MAVTTRSKAKNEAQERENRGKAGQDEREHWNIGNSLDDSLFEFRPTSMRVRLSRASKRENKRRFRRNVQEKAYPNDGDWKDLDFGVEELHTLQENDNTLADVRKGLKEGDPRFMRKASLIYRSPGIGESHTDQGIEQLVLPLKCRDAVLKLAHEAPLAGHMGRNKTVKRILQRFYWPGVYRDVAEYCRSCSKCQKADNRKHQPVPLVPLPVMTEPFSRIAMDIVGPLLRSTRGHKYILVVCDYATRYPEAIPLRSCEAEVIAEELMKLFSRVGLPKEILTDQGSNFTSQLLQELY